MRQTYHQGFGQMRDVTNRLNSPRRRQGLSKSGLKMSLPTVVRGDSSQMFKSDESQSLVLFLHIKFEISTKEIRGYVALLMDIPSVEELR